MISVFIRGRFPKASRCISDKEISRNVNRLQRCVDCICLVEQDNEMFCDQYNYKCVDIGQCGEKVGSR